MKKTRIETPLGPIIAVATDTAVTELLFRDEKIAPEQNPILEQLTYELELYFSGKLTTFTTSLNPIGTPFQTRVWQALQQIPYGTTISYKELAQNIGRPTAFRTVAKANSANPICILIPCHRVINTGGALGGYSGGLDKKIGLLKTEKKSDLMRQLQNPSFVGAL